MDFEIEIEQGTGRGSMTFTKAENIMNNVYLSLMVKKGSFFFNRDFGLQKQERAKCTDKTAALAKDYALDALNWLKELARAKEITVQARRVDTHRIERTVEVTQADGLVVSYTTFVEVV